MPNLILAGNETTDAVRAAALAGDGRPAPDNTIGVYKAATNFLSNGNAATNLNGVTQYGSTVVHTREAGFGFFGSTCFKITRSPNPGQFQGFCSPAVVVGVGIFRVAHGWFSPEAGTSIADMVVGIEEYSDVGGTVFLRRTTVNATAALRTREKGGRTWYLIAVPVTTGASCASIRAAWYHTGLAGGGAPEAGEIVYVSGCQIETGMVATPYHHTDGASSTRNAGNVQLPPELVTPARGWFVVWARPAWTPAFEPEQGTGFAYVATLSNAAGTEQRTIMWREASNEWRFRTINLGASVGDAVSAVDTWTLGDWKMIAGYWQPTVPKTGISFDGSNFVVFGNPTADPGAMDRLTLLSNRGSSNHFCGDLGWAGLGTGPITATDVGLIRQMLLRGYKPQLEDMPPAMLATAIFDGDDLTYDDGVNAAESPVVQRWPRQLSRRRSFG